MYICISNGKKITNAQILPQKPSMSLIIFIIIERISLFYIIFSVRQRRLHDHTLKINDFDIC